jgi:hypothetical protein
MPRLQYEEWQEVGESSRLRALPRIDEIETSRSGFDRDQVADAFVTFEAHIASLRSQLEQARSAERESDLPGSALRADGLALISAATDYANKIEREATVTATRELRAVHAEVEQHRQRMEELERRMEREREDNERAAERMIAEARSQAREIMAEARAAAKEERRRGEEEARQLIQQGEGEAAEFTRTARARADELLEWARKRSAELMEEARTTTQELLGDIPDREPAGDEEPVAAERLRRED